MPYAIAECTTTERSSVYGGGKTVTAYVVRSPGRYPTRRAAKVAWMITLDPDLKGAPEDFIVRHFDQQARNLGHFKVVRAD